MKSCMIILLLLIVSYSSYGYLRRAWATPASSWPRDVDARHRQKARRRLHDETITMDIEAIKTKQFDQFSKNQIGKWIGVHTGYDPEEITVADHLYVESLMEPTDGGGIRHTNSFVVGEIRTDCEVCFDSDRVKTREVGVYEKDKMRMTKTCGASDVRGPSPTPRGMSMEFTIRDEQNSRIRVLLAHSPVSFADVRGMGQVPDKMLLTDIIIVRERIGSRPLELDDPPGPDRMWHKTPKERLEGQFSGVREKVGMNGDLESVEIEGGICLPSVYLDDFKHKLKDEGDDRNNNIYRRVFPGGILVECPSIVKSGCAERVRISWMPCGGKLYSLFINVFVHFMNFLPSILRVPFVHICSQDNKLFICILFCLHSKSGLEKKGPVVAAEIMFDALVVDEGAADDNILRLHPPRVLKYFVDRLLPSD